MNFQRLAKTACDNLKEQELYFALGQLAIKEADTSKATSPTINEPDFSAFTKVKGNKPNLDDYLGTNDDVNSLTSWLTGAKPAKKNPNEGRVRRNLSKAKLNQFRDAVSPGEQYTSPSTNNTADLPKTEPPVINEAHHPLLNVFNYSPYKGPPADPSAMRNSGTGTARKGKMDMSLLSSPPPKPYDEMISKLVAHKNQQAYDARQKAEQALPIPNGANAKGDVKGLTKWLTSEKPTPKLPPKAVVVGNLAAEEGTNKVLPLPKGMTAQQYVDAHNKVLEQITNGAIKPPTTALGRLLAALHGKTTSTEFGRYNHGLGRVEIDPPPGQPPAVGGGEGQPPDQPNTPNQPPAQREERPQRFDEIRRNKLEDIDDKYWNRGAVGEGRVSKDDMRAIRSALESMLLNKKLRMAETPVAAKAKPKADYGLSF